MQRFYDMDGGASKEVLLQRQQQYMANNNNRSKSGRILTNWQQYVQNNMGIARQMAVNQNPGATPRQVSTQAFRIIGDDYRSKGYALEPKKAPVKKPRGPNKCKC